MWLPVLHNCKVLLGFTSYSIPVSYYEYFYTFNTSVL